MVPWHKTVATYISHQLNPNKDHDAFFVLMVSLVVMALSAGVFYLLLLILVIHKARISSTQPGVPANTIYILFGKKLNNDLPDQEYQCRLIRLLHNQFNTVVLMGGKNGDTNNSEAKAGLRFLQQNGLERNKTVLLEQSSKNTLENLKNTRQILKNQPVVILSNRYHLARCSVLADNLSITHSLCAAENSFDFTLCNLGKCLQETFYIHWFFSGKYWAMLTHNKRMLDKIS